MVAGGLFLLVAGFLLFVDDNQAEIFNRCKNRRAGADYDARFAIAHPPQFAGTLHTAQRKVQNRNTFKASAEPRTALASDAKRERDFRNENNCGLAASQCVLNSTEINFSLATPRDAM